MSKYYKMFCVPLLLMTACGPSNRHAKVEVQAFSEVKGLFTQLQVAIAESDPREIKDFALFIKAQDFVSNSSPNRDVCEVIWINTSLESWLNSLTNGTESIGSAIAGQYSRNAELQTVGISFQGRPLEGVQIESPKFIKIERRR